MRVRELVRETAVAAWALKVSSTAIALVAAIVCLASLLTVGRAAAADSQLATRLEEAGSRSFTVVDVQNMKFLNSDVVAAINGLSVVERAYGFSVAQDVVNTAIGPGGEQAPARIIIGDLNEVVRLTEGRWPNPGEAIVTAEAQSTLGLLEPFGSVTFLGSKVQVPVVGRFEATVSLDGVSSVLIRGNPAEPVQVMQAVVDDHGHVEAAMRHARSIIAAANPNLVRIETPVSIAELAESVSGDLAGYSTSILYGVLGIGAIICVLVVFSDALSRRSDLGRRMALGASRSVIMGYTIGRTVLPALIGIALGCAVGFLATVKLGHPAPWSFTAGVAILTLIVTTLSAIPGALWAAHQDPVAVLRIP